MHCSTHKGFESAYSSKKVSILTFKRHWREAIFAMKTPVCCYCLPFRTLIFQSRKILNYPRSIREIDISGNSYLGIFHFAYFFRISYLRTFSHNFLSFMVLAIRINASWNCLKFLKCLPTTFLT